MNYQYKKQLKKLEEITEQGVILFYEEKPARPVEFIKEGMYYEPEFLVVDENGILKEIWY